MSWRSTELRAHDGVVRALAGLKLRRRQRPSALVAGGLLLQAGVMGWTDHVAGDLLPWLLSPETPAVRAATLQRLLGTPAEDREVVAARAAAMEADPIRSILQAQSPEGWWIKPGAGYSPKYTGTVWELIFLDQLGADGADQRIQLACEYVLDHAQTATGGFGPTAVKSGGPPPPSRAVHCLNGNLVRALAGFGHLDDLRVGAAIEWAARSITGEGMDRYYASGTSGPGFACAANEQKPCAWGAVKELMGLARVPPTRRSGLVRAAINQGVEFLLSRDPAVVDYPTLSTDTKPSAAWFKLGFPSGYVSDVLQNLEVLCELGHARDPRLATALAWVEGQQRDGFWSNRYSYNGKTVVDIERQGRPSKWVTLRACTVLKAAWGK